MTAPRSTFAKSAGQPVTRDNYLNSPFTAAMNVSSSPDPSMLRRVAQGDREALGELCDLYSQPLYSLAFYILRDVCEAEEVLQDVFLKMWAEAPFLHQAKGRLFNWAAGETRHQAVGRLRGRHARDRPDEGPPRDRIEAMAGGETLAGEDFSSVQAGKIQAAFNALPGEQQRPIELALFGGLSCLEMSEILKVSPESIAAGIRTGMLHLKQALD